MIIYVKASILRKWEDAVSEPKGAIPRLIILVLSLILGFWFAIPGEIDIAVIILEAFAKAIQPLNVEQANRIVQTYIVFLRFFGGLLIIASILGIYNQLKRRRFF